MDDQSLFPTRKPVGMMQLVDPAAVAAAEAAKAQIQAAYIVAMQKPRNQMQARTNILMACKRTEFAEKAEYSKPIGNTKITGPSVRFAELAIREWENVRVETVVLYEDEDVKRLRVSAIDLETNAQFSRDIQIKKTIERKSKKGREGDIITERKNTFGDIVYVLRATDDEMLTKESAWVSKIIRNEGLRLIPTDIIEEGLKQARETLQSRAAMDPDGEKKKIVDAFAGIGIKPVQIEKYIGHGIGTIAPAEIAELRSIYRTIRDGEASWNDYIKTNDQTDNGAQEKNPNDGVADSLKDRKGPSLYGGNKSKPSETISKDVEKPETKGQDEKSVGESPSFGEGMNEEQLWELLRNKAADAGIKTPESFANVKGYIQHNVETTGKLVVEVLRTAVNTKPTDLMLSVTNWYTTSQQANGQHNESTGTSRYSGANSQPPEGTRLDGLPEWNENHPFWPDRWAKMRTGDGVKTGLAAYVNANEKAIGSMPDGQQRELVDKFERIYESRRFPFQLPWMQAGESEHNRDGKSPQENTQGQDQDQVDSIDAELRASRSDLLSKKNHDEKLFNMATKNLFQKNAISTTFPQAMNLDECQAVVDEMSELAELRGF